MPILKSTFGGGGEKGRDLSLDGGCDKRRMCIRNGRGGRFLPKRARIMSPPGKPTLVIGGDTKWPSKGDSVRIISTRPTNSLLTSYWEIVDPEGSGRTEDETSLIGTKRLSRYITGIGWMKWISCS